MDVGKVTQGDWREKKNKQGQTLRNLLCSQIIFLMLVPLSECCNWCCSENKKSTQGALHYINGNKVNSILWKCICVMYSDYLRWKQPPPPQKKRKLKLLQDSYDKELLQYNDCIIPTQHATSLHCHNISTFTPIIMYYQTCQPLSVLHRSSAV